MHANPEEYKKVLATTILVKGLKTFASLKKGLPAGKLKKL
jgi:hypothetical protein